MEISSLSLQHKAMESAHLETQQQQEKKARPQPEQSLKCPRCDSTNTKFCYYNNYNLSQPRYFCKGCRRYWTKGGSLRNVPVGGGCRRNGKTSSSSKKSQDQDLTTNPLFLPPLPLPPLSFDPNDLTLAFASLQNQPTIGEKGDHFMLSNPNSTPFLDILRGGSFQSLYYGFGGNVEEVEGGDVSGENGHMMFSLDGGILNGTINGTAAADEASGDHGGGDGTTSMATWWG